MGIKSLSNSSGIVNFQKHQSMLAGIELNKFHHLETVRLGSSAASVEFTNLGQYSDYQHLELRIIGRTDRASSSDYLEINFNGDTGSNYSYHAFYGNGSTYTFATPGVSASAIHVNRTGAASSASSVFGAIKIDILDAFNSLKYKTLTHFGGFAFNTVEFGGGSWRSLSSLTSITIRPGSGSNLILGSRFSLYGSKVGA